MRHGIQVSTYLIGCVRRLTLRLASCFEVIVSSMTFFTYHSGLPSSSARSSRPESPSWP